MTSKQLEVARLSLGGYNWALKGKSGVVRVWAYLKPEIFWALLSNI